MTCLPSSVDEGADRLDRLVRRCRGRGSARSSGMTGTGLKKCIPTNRSRRSRVDRLGEAVDRDRRGVRGEDRVGPARCSSSSRQSADLTATSSKTASMTRSASAHVVDVGGRLDPGERRVAVRRRSGGPWRPPDRGWPAIRSRPASARARSGSYRTTGLPIAAWTWAMPWPISPAPATKTRSIGSRHGVRWYAARPSPRRPDADGDGRYAASLQLGRAAGRRPCTGRGGGRRPRRAAAPWPCAVSGAPRAAARSRSADDRPDLGLGTGEARRRTTSAVRAGRPVPVQRGQQLRHARPRSRRS